MSGPSVSPHLGWVWRNGQRHRIDSHDLSVDRKEHSDGPHLRHPSIIDDDHVRRLSRHDGGVTAWYREQQTSAAATRPPFQGSRVSGLLVFLTSNAFDRWGHVSGRRRRPPPPPPSPAVPLFPVRRPFRSPHRLCLAPAGLPSASSPDARPLASPTLRPCTRLRAQRREALAARAPFDRGGGVVPIRRPSGPVR